MREKHYVSAYGEYEKRLAAYCRCETAETTETTETEDGADAFDQAGSLCHGWSAMPVYFYYAYGLGVRPVKPGFARTADAARRMDGCYGSVPTPEGMIHVEKKAK